MSNGLSILSKKFQSCKDKVKKSPLTPAANQTLYNNELAMKQRFFNYLKRKYKSFN